MTSQLERDILAALAAGESASRLEEIAAVKEIALNLLRACMTPDRGLNGFSASDSYLQPLSTHIDGQRPEIARTDATHRLTTWIPLGNEMSIEIGFAVKPNLIDDTGEILPTSVAMSLVSRDLDQQRDHQATIWADLGRAQVLPGTRYMRTPTAQGNIACRIIR